MYDTGMFSWRLGSLVVKVLAHVTKELGLIPTSVCEDLFWCPLFGLNVASCENIITHSLKWIWVIGAHQLVIQRH